MVAEFKRDMSAWELIEDMREPTEIAIENLEIVSFLNHDETSVVGEEMRKRAKKIGANLGQRHLEEILEHREDIPAEWRGYSLFFPGTVWSNFLGGPHVPYLSYFLRQWGMSLLWLDREFDSHARLVRSRK